MIGAIKTFFAALGFVMAMMALFGFFLGGSERHKASTCQCDCRPAPRVEPLT